MTLLFIQIMNIEENLQKAYVTPNSIVFRLFSIMLYLNLRYARSMHNAYRAHYAIWVQSYKINCIYASKTNKTLRYFVKSYFFTTFAQVLCGVQYYTTLHVRKAIV
jgi:hypothetical protein